MLLPRAAHPAIDHEMGDVDAFSVLARAALCARPRKANFPIAKAAECRCPFTLALARVGRIAPGPCVSCAVPPTG